MSLGLFLVFPAPLDPLPGLAGLGVFFGGSFVVGSLDSRHVLCELVHVVHDLID